MLLGALNPIFQNMADPVVCGNSLPALHRADACERNDHMRHGGWRVASAWSEVTGCCNRPTRHIQAQPCLRAVRHTCHQHTTITRSHGVIGSPHNHRCTKGRNKYMSPPLSLVYLSRWFPPRSLLRSSLSLFILFTPESNGRQTRTYL